MAEPINSSDWVVIEIPIGSQIPKVVDSLTQPFEHTAVDDKKRTFCSLRYTLEDLDFISSFLKKYLVPFRSYHRFGGGLIMCRIYNPPDEDVEFSLDGTLRPIIRLRNISQMIKDNSLDSKIQTILNKINKGE